MGKEKRRPSSSFMEVSSSSSSANLYTTLRFGRTSRIKFLSAVAAPLVRPPKPGLPPSVSLDARKFGRNCGIPWGIGGFRRRNLKKSPFLQPQASGMESPGTSKSGNVDMRIVAGSATTVVLAVANRVLYKLALIPMKEFPFFLAQMTTFG